MVMVSPFMNICPSGVGLPKLQYTSSAKAGIGTLSVTVPAGLANSVLVYFSCQGSSTQNVSSVSSDVNGALTKEVEQDTGLNHVALFYLVNPTAGAHVLAGDPDAATNIQKIAQVWSSVDQSSPFIRSGVSSLTGYTRRLSGYNSDGKNYPLLTALGSRFGETWSVGDGPTSVTALINESAYQAHYAEVGDYSTANEWFDYDATDGIEAAAVYGVLQPPT